MSVQEVCEGAFFSAFQAAALTKMDRTTWAVEEKDGDAICADGMDVRRTVIVRKDHDAEIAEPQDRGHPDSLDLRTY